LGLNGYVTLLFIKGYGRYKRFIYLRGLGIEEDKIAQITRDRIKTFWHGLPPLGRHLISSSEPSQSSNHARYKIKKKSLFKHLKTISPKLRNTSAIWELHKKDTLKWSSENDIQGLIATVIKDAIGLKERLSCFTELIRQCQ
jgi:hypothetical protein